MPKKMTFEEARAIWLNMAMILKKNKTQKWQSL